MKSTSFQLGDPLLNGSGQTVYDWIDPLDWTNGVPSTGDDVTFDVSATVTYSEYLQLSLDTLNLESAAIAIMGSLTIGSLVIGPGTARSVQTMSVDNSAKLTIDQLSGAGAIFGATGPHSLTTVLAPTDPGETYSVANAGELVLAAQPNAASTLSFGPVAGDTGVIALENPGSTVSTALDDVQIGAMLEVPGSYVSAVAYGSHSIAVTTSLGTTTFSNVNFEPGVPAPTGFTAAYDPLLGLQEITFTAAQTTTFQLGATVNLGGLMVHLWSNASNWTSGVPQNGANANVQDNGYFDFDDINGLSLNVLNLQNSNVYVTESLTVDNLTLGAGSIRDFFASTYDSPGQPSLGIGTLAGSGWNIGADGAGATVAITGSSDPGENYSASEGGQLTLAATPSASSILGFGGNSTIGLRNPGGTVATPLEGVAVGDSVELPGTSVSSVSFDASSLTIVTDVGTTLFSDVSYVSGSPLPTTFSATADASTGLLKITFACYARGTRILTTRGEIPVEHLRAGDLAVTVIGRTPRPITWIGHRRVACARHPEPRLVWPVHVAPGAFGSGLPRRSLLVSPDHAIYANGVLVPAKLLVNGATITQERCDAITYFHVELDRHDALVAEGLAAESDLDAGNRSAFANGGAFMDLHPDFTPLRAADSCRPYRVDGDAVTELRRTLLARAEALGFTQTAEADVHLRVDGRRIDGEADGPRLRFTLPGGARAVVLCSRATAPAWLDPQAADWRQLGVAVSALTLDGQPLPLGHPALSAGFHPAEASGASAWRWTDGEAVLPVARTIEVVIAATQPAWTSGSAREGMRIRN